MDYISLKQIKRNREEYLASIFREFSDFEENLENFEIARKELKNCCIPFKFESGMSIRYIDKTYFYSLSLSPPCKVLDVYDDFVEVFINDELLNIEKKYIFQILSEEDKLKIELGPLLNHFENENNIQNNNQNNNQNNKEDLNLKIEGNIDINNIDDAENNYENNGYVENDKDGTYILETIINSSKNQTKLDKIDLF